MCFMGSGHDDEDKYVNMVVSNFLQRKINFVSLALGGYDELRNTIEDPEMIVGIEFQAASRKKFTEDWIKKINTPAQQSHSNSNVIIGDLPFIYFCLRQRLNIVVFKNTKRVPNQ